MHINIKPNDKHTLYVTGEQAINHLFIFGIYANKWDQDGQSFGQNIALWKTINDAIKFRDFSAFKAEKRRGYWKISLKM